MLQGRVRDSPWEADFVAILRDHAPICNSCLSLGSRFCRYFAWSRSFLDLTKNSGSRFCRYFAWSRPFLKLPIKLESRFCRYVAWSRSFFWCLKKLESRFCRYFAWSRSFCWSPAKLESRFCRYLSCRTRFRRYLLAAPISGAFLQAITIWAVGPGAGPWHYCPNSADL